MSREMRGFADYFMRGMQMGAGWAEKWQAQQIAKERNRLAAERQKAQDARENRKLDIYGHGVMANAELARARAANVGKTKGGGGGGGAATSSADADALRKEASDRGIITAPGAPPAPAQQNFYGGTSDAPISDVPQPPAAETSAAPVESDSKGGLVGSKRYAEGGIVEGMSLHEAQEYGSAAGPGGSSDTSERRAKPAADPFSSAMAGAAGKYKAPEEKNKDEDVRPTGPVGSGPGGSYTTADTGPGGVISTNYRAGGSVQPQAQANTGWYAEGGKVRYASNEDRLIEPKSTSGMADVPVGRGRLSMGANYDPNSRYGTAEAGYEHPVGRNTTLGVQGNIGKDLGPEGANAKADWGVGLRGRVKFEGGGRVTRFQSGGRVMREQAIDTGTTGPGSGYGYRAAPPARR